MAYSTTCKYIEETPVTSLIKPSPPLLLNQTKPPPLKFTLHAEFIELLIYDMSV